MSKILAAINNIQGISVLSKNVIFILSGNVLVLLISLPYMSILAKYLGSEGFGIYSVTLAYSSIITMVIDLGAGKIITHEIVKNKYHKSLSLVTLVVPKIFVVVFFVLAFSFIKPFPGGFLVIILCISIGLFMNLSVSARSIFNAYERNEFNVIGLITERIVTFTSAILFLVNGFGVVGVLVSVCLGNFSDMLISWLLVWKHYWHTFGVSASGHIRKYLRLGFPIFIAAVVSTVYYRSPTIIIEKRVGPDAAGWFNAALQLIIIVWYVPQAIGYVVFPYFTKLVSKQDKETNHFNYFMILIMFVLGILASFTLLIFSGWIIETLYGEAFTPSIRILQILSLSIPFTFASTIAIQSVISKGYQGHYAGVYGVVSSLGVIMFVSLVPSHGMIFAAIIFVIIEVLSCVLFNLLSIRLNRTHCRSWMQLKRAD